MITGLHPEWTEDRVKAFSTLVRTPVGDRESAIAAFHALSDTDKAWMASTVLAGAQSLCGGNAYIVPVLSEEMCDSLTLWADGQSWAENDGEEPDYRMDEIVIAHVDDDLDQYLKTVLLYGLAPFMVAIFGKVPDAWNSVQLTRYDASRTGGAYHVDATSKYTAVISLNPDEFEGGGTRMVSGVFGSIVVPPLPKGWALIFRGREIFHKGEPITKGTRKLLTVWTDDNDSQD